MPGPAWKEKVRNTENNIDRCRRQIDKIVGLDPDGQEIVKEVEVYKNQNMVVEVAIKTKKPKDRDEGDGKNRVRRNVDRGGEKWKNIIQEKGSKVEGKRLIRRRTEDDDDDGDGEKGRFQNRTLQIFLREMRAALKQQEDGGGTKVNKILDDLEYVAGNLGGQKQQRGFAVENERQRSPSKKGRVSDLEAALTNKTEQCRKKDKEISGLKDIVSRLTANNNEMLALLTQKVGLEDSLKNAKKANEDALSKLVLEKQKTAQLSARVAKGEAETLRLRKIIDDLQKSLNRDLDKVYPSRPPTAASAASGRLASSGATKPNLSQTTDLGISEIDDGDDKTTDHDSAIEEGNSESQQLSTKQSLIIEKAKDLLGSGDKVTKSLEAIRDEPTGNFKELDLSETRGSGELGDTTPTIGESPRKDSPLPPPPPPVPTQNKVATDAIKSTLDADVESFLERMRRQKDLNVTLPKLPTAKSFDGSATANFELTATELLKNDSTLKETLSESRFRQGLETTLSTTTNSDKPDQ